MGILSKLEPAKVFEHFENICSIPHGSYNEKAVSDYCINVAKSKDLWCTQDALGNVIIIKEASKGRENDAAVIIQGHLDMVCEKESDCDFDFEKDSLRLSIDGDMIKAEGTTLGGDDGIAVAMGLALLDEPDMPRLELVFTVCEEVGMEGAIGIDLSPLKGKIMLNLDSEEEGYFLTSCAGGESVKATFNSEKQKTAGELVTVEVSGLVGGHSGTEIHKEHGNANVIMARILREMPCEYALVSFDGGDKDNAIPRQCRADIVLTHKNEADKDCLEKLEKYISETENTLKKEFFVSDKDISVKMQKCGEQTVNAFGREDTVRFVRALSVMPNGVCNYCQAMPDTVETSLNIGTIRTNDNSIVVRMSLRSSVVSRKEELAQRIEALCNGFGLEFCVSSSYPAWEYKADSLLREKIAKIYKSEYGREAVFCSIHAGLECGVLSEKINDLDCVSMGPDIFDIHTPKEHLSISSTQRVYEFVKKIL